MEQQYYLLSLKWSKGDYFVWWGPNNNGYTANLDRAGIYTQSQIDSIPIYYSNQGTMPIPVEDVRNTELKMTVVPMTIDCYKTLKINQHLEMAPEY